MISLHTAEIPLTKITHNKLLGQIYVHANGAVQNVWNAY